MTHANRSDVRDDLIDRHPWQRRTYVRTPGVISGGLTVWHVRKWVEALDAAGIPDSAIVTDSHNNETRHLDGLSAYNEEEKVD